MALAVHYQGTRSKPVAPVSEARRLTDFDVMPLNLAEKISGTKRLDIQEPLSFPFEDLPTSASSIPLTIHLPSEGSAGSDSQTLIALLGPSVLDRLTVLDTVSASDEAWINLQQRYGWPNWMRVDADAFSSNTEVLDTEATEAKLADYGQSPYDNFWIRTTQNKERLLAIRTVIEQNLKQVRDLHHRDVSIQLHGYQTATFVPMLWPDLSSVSEKNPAGRLLLRKNYPGRPFEIIDQDTSPTSRHQKAESADIVVGVGNLSQAKNKQIQDSFNTIFDNLRVGGTMLICERLNGVYGPNDLLELLLNASNHDLVMDDMETIRVPSDESHEYAVMAFSKLGTPKR